MADLPTYVNTRPSTSLSTKRDMSMYVEMKSKARRFRIKIGWTFVGILLIIEHIYMISYIAGVQSGPREKSSTNYDRHNIGQLGK